MLLSSTSTPRRSKLASRRPRTVTNLELNTNHLSQQALTTQTNCIPDWRPMLGEIDVNLRAMKEFFLPLGGEDFNVKDSNGRTSLHEAVQMGYEAVVEYLVLRGASIYEKDYEGVTPLVLANRFGNQKMTSLLLGKGHIQEHDEILGRPFEEEEGYLSLMSMKMTKKDAVKWAFALLNVGVEFCQALLSQEGTTNQKNEATCYRRVSVALSLLCLLLSISEMVYEAKRDRVVWKKIFGSFMLWFGLLSSIVQLCLSLVTLTINKDVLKFDYMGLLLSICYLLSRLGRHKMSMRGVMKCGEHGEREVGGRLEKGRWVFECLLCRLERDV